MTDEEAKALGLRALAAGFRWAAGVLWLALDAETGEPCEGRVDVSAESAEDLWSAEIVTSPWPDFRDPATLGVLVAQVREACDEPIHTAPCDDGGGGVYEWRAWPFADLSRYWTGSTEAHALVAALEAAL